MKRRTLLAIGAAGLAGSHNRAAGGAQIEGRKITTTHRHDVIIAGGGPSGCAAALTAARMGADVALIEQYPCFGGVWTMGTLAIIIDSQNKNTGMMKLIKDKLRNDGYLEPFYRFPTMVVYNVEAMKLLLDDMLSASGAKLRLHTFIADVEKEGGAIKSLITASKSGFERWEGKVFIDCTGDGDVAALAGCEFNMGREEDGKMQPGTTYGLVGGWKGEVPGREEMLDIFTKAGKEIPYLGMYVFPQLGMKNMGYLMPSHVYGLDPTDAESLTASEMEGRRQVRYVIDVLKKYGGDKFSELFLASIAPCVGIREGRRIVGKYYLNADDLAEGRKFDDGICDVEFTVDIHHVDKNEGAEEELYHVRTKPYQVPFRSLQVRDCQNLLTAGRCISGSFEAHGSYRVTGNSVPIGEAAGVGAVMAVEKNMRPIELDGVSVRNTVERIRQEIPG